MELRPLGKTGLMVSPIGLGTVKIGRNEGVKYPGGGGFALPDDAAVAALFAKARELGVNLIDTAPAYGTSEERIGAVMRRNGWFGGREGRGGWVVVTKAGEEFQGGVSRFDFSPSAIERSVERSLERLGTEWVDVVLLHCGPADEQGRGDVWAVRESGALKALEGLKRAGKVRAVGASTKTVEGGLAAVERGCDVVMVTYNVRETGEGVVIDLAAEKGVGVLVKKGLMSGWVGEGGVGEALQFVLGKRGVSSVVVGTGNVGHLKEMVGW